MMAQYRHLIPYTRRADERLGVEVAGLPLARSIMFLHCAGANRRIWLPQMHRLADAFQVIALDLPGHGALADMPFSLQAAREHVVAVMGAWAGRRALIVGLSLGGYAGVDLAHHCPDRVAGLVLSGSSAVSEGVLGMLTHIAATLLTVASRISPVNSGLRRLIRVWLRYGLMRGVPMPEANAVLEAITAAGIYPRAAGAAFLEVARQDVVRQLRSFSGPVLLINGASEKISRSGEAKLLAAAQHGQLCIIPQSCHATSLEQPDAFADAVRRFAAEIE